MELGNAAIISEKGIGKFFNISDSFVNSLFEDGAVSKNKADTYIMAEVADAIIDKMISGKQQQCYSKEMISCPEGLESQQNWKDAIEFVYNIVSVCTFRDDPAACAAIISSHIHNIMTAGAEKGKKTETPFGFLVPVRRPERKVFARSASKWTTCPSRMDVAFKRDAKAIRGMFKNEKEKGK